MSSMNGNNDINVLSETIPFNLVTTSAKYDKSLGIALENCMYISQYFKSLPLTFHEEHNILNCSLNAFSNFLS